MTQPSKFSSKLPRVGTNIFTVISQMAVEHNAINLGQGFPDYAMPQALVDLTTKAMQDGHNQYAHSYGYPLLREVLIDKMNNQYGCKLNANDHITITPGGTYALFTALNVLLRPGNEAIIIQPAYDCYVPQVLVNGAIPILVPMLLPHYTIDWQTLEASITDNTRVIIINSPHNPTGQVYTTTDLLKLEAIVEQHPNITIISDEVYEHLVFGGAQHQSVLAYPLLAQRSIACFSLGKVFNCTGWKMGYAVAPKWLTDEFRKIHQYNVFACFTPSQVALATYLQTPANYLSLGPILGKKQQLFQEMLAQTPLVPQPVFGSYFQLYSYAGLSTLNELEYATQLIKKAGVAAIPISAFYVDNTNNNMLRFCFAKKESTLEDAANRLIQYFNNP